MGDGAESEVPELEPVFRHLDDLDVPWQQVRAVRLADGTVASVWEKWLAFSADPLYLSLYARWDPGVIQRTTRSPQPARRHGPRGRDPLR